MGIDQGRGEGVARSGLGARSTRACCRRHRWRWRTTGSSSHFETFGDATDDTRYVVYSATKAFVAGAMWALIGDGSVDVSPDASSTHIPEFGTNGKDVITVEQVMLHTSGFPHAPLPLLSGETSAPAGRGLRQVAARTGSRGRRTSTTPSSAHWVLAEIIERVTGRDFRDVVQQRVTDPAGLPRVLGERAARWRRRCTWSVNRRHPTSSKRCSASASSTSARSPTDALLGFNDPAVQRVGDARRWRRDASQRPGDVLPGGPAQPG